MPGGPWWWARLTGRRSLLRTLSPLPLVLVVVVADLHLGDAIVFGVLAAVPLMASALLGPRAVWIYGVLCPGQVLAALDRTVARHGDPEEFVTALLQLGDDGTCVLLNAGHPPPLLVRDGAGSLLAQPEGSPPLGLGVEELPLTVLLRPADRLLLYTDGLIEARRPSDRAFFSLAEVAGCFGTGSLEDGIAALRQQVTDWAGGRLDDDVAMLAVQRAALVSSASGSPAPASAGGRPTRP